MKIPLTLSLRIYVLVNKDTLANNPTMFDILQINFDSLTRQADRQTKRTEMIMRVEKG